MVDGRPQHAGRVVQIAIRLNVDRQAAVLLVRERGAHGGWRPVADAVRAVSADELMMLPEVPQPRRPKALEYVARNERPVLPLDLAPDFRRQPGCGDGARVPAPCRFTQGLVVTAPGVPGEARSALVEDSPAIRRNETLARVDE